MDAHHAASLTVGITGHRPSRIDDPAWVRNALSEQLEILGATKVVLGLADGVDQWAAAAAWRHGIPFIGVLPWRGHRQGSVEQQWCLRHAERIVEINPAQVYPGPFVYHERNEWIVSHSDVLLAVWDGKKSGGTYQTVRRAQSRGVLLHQINPVSREIGSPDGDPTLFSGLDIEPHR